MTTAATTMPTIEPIDRLRPSMSRRFSKTGATHPAVPDGVAVVIAVTVFTAPPVVVLVPVAVPVAVPAAGVELGDESSIHAELLELPTVSRLLVPP